MSTLLAVARRHAASGDVLLYMAFFRLIIATSVIGIVLGSLPAQDRDTSRVERLEERSLEQAVTVAKIAQKIDSLESKLNQIESMITGSLWGVAALCGKYVFEALAALMKIGDKREQHE